MKHKHKWQFVTKGRECYHDDHSSIADYVLCIDKQNYLLFVCECDLTKKVKAK